MKPTSLVSYSLTQIFFSHLRGLGTKYAIKKRMAERATKKYIQVLGSLKEYWLCTKQNLIGTVLFTFFANTSDI